MMTTLRWGLLGSLLSVLMVMSSPGFADTARPLNKHEIAWRHFANQLLALHQKRLKTFSVVKKTRVGGYAHQPAFYREESYYTADDSHRLISRVRWEKAHPDKLHTIEVYFYDAQGRVIRDYTAAYLPDYYRSPSQTLISFHVYHRKLHAFRSFDADGIAVDEGCRGQYQGRHVEIILDEAEIADGAPEMQTAAYSACFDGLPQKPGSYLIPQ